LTEELRQALLAHTGSRGTIVHGVLAYEHGRWEDVLALALDADVVRDAYLSALAWAIRIRETLA